MSLHTTMNRFNINNSTTSITSSSGSGVNENIKPSATGNTPRRGSSSGYSIGNKHIPSASSNTAIPSQLLPTVDLNMNSTGTGSNSNSNNTPVHVQGQGQAGGRQIRI